MFVRPLIALLCCFGWLATAHAAEKPNIIYVLADDLGYGDLSCYGQKVLKSPNLDQMASEGIRFTRHYAGSTVCAPARCVLLTGKHTGHASVRGNQPARLKPGEMTLGTLLQAEGYQTACIGKWGVGHPPPLDDPNQHGFHEFYGYVNMFHAHNFYPEFLVRNGKKEPLGNQLLPEWRDRQTPEKEGFGVAEVKQDYAPDLLLEESLKFIENNRDRPFFLYYALNVPHANNEGRSAGMEVPDVAPFDEQDWPAAEKGFARMIANIDRDLGKILAKLKELDLDDNTIVFFSSDNGPHQEGGHLADFFDSSGPLRGKKRDLYEGGIRVPLIARWPGKIPAGAVTNHISGFQDMLPTLAELTAAEIPTSDGVSLLPALRGDRESQKEHSHLYWEFQEQGGKQAVLKEPWKGVRLDWNSLPKGEIELYNLEKDPAETNNVAADHPEVVHELMELLEKSHVPQ